MEFWYWTCIFQIQHLNICDLTRETKHFNICFAQGWFIKGLETGKYEANKYGKLINFLNHIN